MKSVTLAIICIVAAQGAGSAAIDMDSYKWKHRLILVFAPSVESDSYQILKQDIERQRHEIADRDIVLFWIYPDEVRSGDRVFGSSAAVALRERYSIPPDVFGVILIGKDGGEKLKQEERGNLAEIFSRIDAMPMRQMEMKQKSREE
jgi:hypothetical protein